MDFLDLVKNKNTANNVSVRLYLIKYGFLQTTTFFSEEKDGVCNASIISSNEFSSKSKTIL